MSADHVAEAIARRIRADVHVRTTVSVRNRYGRGAPAPQVTFERQVVDPEADIDVRNDPVPLHPDDPAPEDDPGEGHEPVEEN